jgi:hypothetical protein
VIDAPVASFGSGGMLTEDRLHRALAMLVIGAIAAATAALIAAIALISRGSAAGVRNPEPAQGGSEPENTESAARSLVSRQWATLFASSVPRSAAPARLILWFGAAGHGRDHEQYTADQTDECDHGSEQEHDTLHAERVAAQGQRGHGPIVRAEHPSSGSVRPS